MYKNTQNAALLGLTFVSIKDLSPFAHFWLTFIGYSFLDTETNTILNKRQMYYRSKSLALNMANTLIIPQRYQLVNSIGWSDGVFVGDHIITEQKPAHAA